MLDSLRIKTKVIGMVLASLLMIFSLNGCGHVILPEFPEDDPEIMYTVFLQGEKCFARCYSLSQAKTVNPELCGLPEGTPESWEEGFYACEEISGFKTKAWAERIVPWLKECRRYVEDHLELINEKITEIIEASDKK